MSVWVKLAASYLPEIVQLAKPLFTRTRSQEAAASATSASSPDATAAQITELQNAATANAEAIRLLAKELQATADAARQATTALEARLAGVRRWAIAATAIAVVSLVSLVFGLLLR